MVSLKQSLQNQNSYCPGTSLQGIFFFSCGSFIVGHMIIVHALRTQKYKICSSENSSKFYKVHWLKPGEGRNYTPSIAFWHLPPSSARIGYATERALFISAQLHVHRRGQHAPKGSVTDKTVEATLRPSTHVNMRRVRPGKKTNQKKRSSISF